MGVSMVPRFHHSGYIDYCFDLVIVWICLYCLLTILIWLLFGSVYIAYCFDLMAMWVTTYMHAGLIDGVLTGKWMLDRCLLF